MRQRRDLLGAAGAAALLLFLLAACGEKPKAKPAADATGAVGGADQAQNEATQLGADIAVVLDRALAYASARSGLAPSSIAEMGMDSLTPKLVRRVGKEGKEIVVTVGFRVAGGRSVASCRATSRLFEDMAVQGRYELPCTMTDGGTRTFTIEPEAAPRK